MNEEQLVTVGPTILRDLRADKPTRTPLGERGIELDDGWYGLLLEMVSDLEVIAKEHPQIKITQIKEKFGHLTVYMHGHWSAGDAVREQIDAIVCKAEARAAKTCPVCGADVKPSGREPGEANYCEKHPRE